MGSPALARAPDNSSQTRRRLFCGMPSHASSDPQRAVVFC